MPNIPRAWLLLHALEMPDQCSWHATSTDSGAHAMCSLDTPDKVQPEAHIYHFSKLSFIKLDDGLPSFEGERAHMSQF